MLWSRHPRHCGLSPVAIVISMTPCAALSSNTFPLAHSPLVLCPMTGTFLAPLPPSLLLVSSCQAPSPCPEAPLLASAHSAHGFKPSADDGYAPMFTHDVFLQCTTVIIPTRLRTQLEATQVICSLPSSSSQPIATPFFLLLGHTYLDSFLIPVFLCFLTSNSWGSPGGFIFKYVLTQPWLLDSAAAALA